MKLISKLQGFSTLRVSPDEAMPPGGIVFPSVIAILKETYKFTVFPEFAPGEMPLVQLSPVGLGLQNGEFDVDGNRVAISQLQLFLNGIVVGAQSTEFSDAILEHVIKLLDGKFGFRLAESEGQRAHISNVVVQFEKPFEDAIPQLKVIQDIMFAEAPPNDEGNKMPLTTKRLAFGNNNRITIDPLQASSMDFTIERRGGASFASNRYFCLAPLESEKHLRILEEIERRLMS
jgi:hypothetical protein